MNEMKGAAFGYVLSSKWNCVLFSSFFFNERSSQWPDFLATVIGLKGTWKREKKGEVHFGRYARSTFGFERFSIPLNAVYSKEC